MFDRITLMPTLHGFVEDDIDVPWSRSIATAFSIDLKEWTLPYCRLFTKDAARQYGKIGSSFSD